MAAGDEVVVLTGSLKGSLGMILGTSKFLIGCYRVHIYGGATCYLHHSALERFWN